MALGVVHEAQRQWVHAERRRELVYGGLHRSYALDDAGGAEGGEGAEVGARTLVYGAHVGALIELFGRHGGGGEPARERAEVADGVLVNGGERAVALGAQAEGLDRRGAVAGSDVLFFTAEHVLDGAAQTVRGIGGEQAGLVRAELAAEAATHVLLDGAHLILAQAERLGDGAAHAEDVLGGAIDGEGAAVPLGRGAVGFHAVVHGGGRLEARLDRDLGLTHASIHVAACVDGWRLVVQLVVGTVGEDAWGVGTQRGLGVHD